MLPLCRTTARNNSGGSDGQDSDNTSEASDMEEEGGSGMCHAVPDLDQVQVSNIVTLSSLTCILF